MPDPKQITRRTIAPRPSTIREDDRSVEFVASTDAPVEVFDGKRWEVVKEVLVQSGLELPKNRQVPVLDSHDGTSVENILGSMRDFRLENGETIGRLYFSRNQRAYEAWQNVRDGHLDSVSVGYMPKDGTWIPEGQTATVGGRFYSGPLQVTTRWQLHEVSLCAIPADPGAKVRSERSEPTQETSAPPAETKQEEKVEDKTKEVPTPTPTPPAPAADTERAVAEAEKRERERLLAIRKMCRMPGCEDLEEELSKPGITVERARELVMERLLVTSKPIGSPKVEIKEEDSTKFRAAASDALVARGVFGYKASAPGADQLARFGFEQIARECLIRGGVNTRYMSKDQVFKALLSRSSSGIPSLSTSDFAHVLEDAANKAMQRGWSYAPQTWRLWCSIGDNPDFKASRRVALSDAPQLAAVPEGGQVTYGKMTDTGESVTLTTYGKKLGFSRQALINDDMGAFDVFRAFGARAGDLVNSLPYAVLVANGNLHDGGALFNSTAVTVGGSGHFNLVASATISTTSLATARHYMHQQTAPQGTKLNITPKYLLVGSEYQTAAELAVGPFVPDATMPGTNPNPFNTLQVICDDNITGTMWFLAADPNMHSTVEVAFLNGNQTPTITQEDSSEILGTIYTCYIDATAKALDYRGLVYVAGS